MRANILGLDHVVILVHDIDAAAATYARLGFSLTPRGFHSIGTQNHCLMFGSDYIELLAVAQPHPVTKYFADFLAVSEGLAAIALSTDDAQKAYASLRESGIEADAPVGFSRPVELSDGPRDARFEIVQLPVDATPGCRTFLCQHFTPELVWRPEYQEHPVGVVAIAGISIVVDDARAAAMAYARVLDAAPSEDSQGWLLQVGSATVSFADRAATDSQLAGVGLPARSAPMLGALHLRVRDRRAAEEALRRGGFNPTRLASGGSAIGAGQAHGVALTFD